MAGLLQQPLRFETPHCELYRSSDESEMALTFCAALLVALPTGYAADHYSYRKAFSVILGGTLAAMLWMILVCVIPSMPAHLV